DSSTVNLVSNNSTKILAKNLNYKVGFDWLPNKNDLIGIKLEGAPGQNVKTTGGRNFTSNPEALGFDYVNSSMKQPDIWKTTNLNFNYSHNTDTMGSSLSIVSDYTRLTEDISSNNFNEFYAINDLQVLNPNNYRSVNENRSQLLSGKVDFVKVLDSTSSFEAGLKLVSSKTLNNYLFERDYTFNGTYVNDTSLSNEFNYNEFTYAGYFNYIKSIGKLNMHLGVRVERTNLQGGTTKNFKLNKQYFNIFPNLSFDYAINQEHDLQLNLSRRINRPNFSDLNPFILFNDQYNYGQGNPFLLPDYTNRAELSYNFMSALSTSVAYSYTKDVILGYTSQNDSTKVTLYRAKNQKSAKSFEYSVFYQKSVIKKWDIMFSGTFETVEHKGDIDGVDFSRKGINYYFYLSNSILVSKNAKLELNTLYIGPSISGIIQSKSRWNASAAIKMSLFNDKLDLTIGAEDIFYSFFWRTRTNFDNQDWTFKRVDDTRRLNIALNYKFGKIKISDRNENASNEEEKRRFNH
ncbi:MAG TPA: outer membrane beta-barrel family protein, partial [Bacteroidia bacterium]|nr:outer membrane beta-barrel family protein [Bacteroidia bacterium]